MLSDASSKLLRVGYGRTLAVRHLGHLTQPILEKKLLRGSPSLGFLAATSLSKLRACSQDIGVVGPESTLEFGGLFDGSPSMMTGARCCLGVRNPPCSVSLIGRNKTYRWSDESKKVAANEPPSRIISTFSVLLTLGSTSVPLVNEPTAKHLATVWAMAAIGRAPARLIWPSRPAGVE